MKYALLILVLVIVGSTMYIHTTRGAKAIEIYAIERGIR